LTPVSRESSSRSRTDAVDVRESVQNFLVAWQIDARNACHVVLSLPLFVLGTALADDADDTPRLITLQCSQIGLTLSEPSNGTLQEKIPIES